MSFLRSAARAATSRGAIAAVALIVAALPCTASAQVEGHGFLFGTPQANLSLRLGYALPSARSDLFTFTTDQLTLGRGDFGGPTVDADFGIRVAERTDVTVSASYSGMSRRSEFRNFIDNNNQPIEQTTRFQRVPLTIGLKQYLTPRGRQIGRYAWVPQRVTPYIGAAIGTEWYRFRQEGDFVDFADSSIYSAVNETSGWGLTTHGDAGLEYTLTPAIALSGQLTYTWANAPVDGDYSGFSRIDLSGLSTTFGVAFRF